MQKYGRNSPRSGMAFGLACALLIAAAWIGTTIAAPIRVGIFSGVGPGRPWHTSVHTAGVNIAAILANPDSANLGPKLIKAPDGFITSFFGLTPYGTTTGTPSAQQIEDFIAALDTLDVLVVPSFTQIGAAVTDSIQRLRLASFARYKGLVSIHSTTDSYGTWATWDSLHGTRFQNHPSSDRAADIHLDSIAQMGPDLSFLNRGLPDSARILEEWFSFTTDGDAIRSQPGLKVTTRLDEASYNGGLGGARAMGADHPMSWYRTFSEGGRFFYTALVHRAQNYMGTGIATTPEGLYFLRRQLYNAILWAAKVDSTGFVTSVNSDKVDRHSPSRFADHARLSLSGGALTVTLLRDGAYTVELRALDGRRVATAQASGKTTQRFSGLSTGSVYLVVIRAEHERLVQRIAVQ